MVLNIPEDDLPEKFGPQSADIRVIVDHNKFWKDRNEKNGNNNNNNNNKVEQKVNMENQNGEDLSKHVRDDLVKKKKIFPILK